jgi:signal transduction histidine kinase
VTAVPLLARGRTLGVVTLYAGATRPRFGPADVDRYEVVFDLGSDVGAIEVDRSQLTQVLTNLVANARDAMPNGGNIIGHWGWHGCTNQGADLRAVLHD